MRRDRYLLQVPRWFEREPNRLAAISKKATVEGFGGPEDEHGAFSAT
jgi:hypothetical protein